MVLLIVTLLLLFSALYFDLRYQRIPNKLCLVGLLAALVLQGYTSQWQGLGQVLLGAGLALLLLLPAFYFRCLGAGDVKLMIAVGALSGPVLLFWSVVYGIIFGTFTSFFLALYKVGWSGFIKMISQGFIKHNTRNKNP
jgi:prepilin peptidase CpaA